MIIGIHPDKNGTESFSDGWASALQARGIKIRWLDLLAPDALEQARGCDGVMWRYIHFPSQKQIANVVLYMIENQLGIPVFPDINTRWHYDDKVAQSYLLKSLDAPIPQTWVFWRERDALEWAETASYPVIFKLASGAGSSNVIRVLNKHKAIRLISRMFRHGVFPMTMNEYQRGGFPKTFRQLMLIGKRALQSVPFVLSRDYPQLDSVFWQPERDYIYFQEFLSGNDFDTRVNIIGERAFAFRRMNRPDDFRASGSGRIDYDRERVDLRCVELAYKVSKKAQFGSMSYDFLIKDGFPAICEMSYTFMAEAVYKCPGHWDSNGSWQEGQMHPEEAQVDEFLRRIEVGHQ